MNNNSGATSRSRRSSTKSNLSDLKKKNENKFETSFIVKLKESGLYQIFIDSIASLSFNNFSLEECYRLLKIQYKYFMNSVTYEEFLNSVLKNKDLRNSYFSYNKTSLQGFLLQILKNESTSNSLISLDLFKIITSQDLNKLDSISNSSENVEFSKETTSTLEKILEGLEELV